MVLSRIWQMVAAWTLTAALAAGAEVENWKGEAFSGALTLADGAFHVKGAKGDVTIPKSGLFCARFGGVPREESGQWAHFIFFDGSRLSGKIPLGNVKSTWEIVRPGGQKFEFPHDQLQALEFSTLLPAVHPEAIPEGPHVVMRNGKTLACSLEWLTALEASVKAGAGKMRLRLENIHQIVFAPAKAVAPASEAFCAQTLSGDKLFGDIRKMNDKTLTIKNAAGSWELPVASLRSLTSCSDKAVSLLTLTPSKRNLVPFIDFVREPRFVIDGNGGLQIGKFAYSRGLATHTRTELTYALDGKFSRLVFEAGIDTSLGGQGNALLLVRGGNDKIAEIPVKAGEKPRYASVSVAGVKNLTLVADFGPDGSSGDHVVWGNPLLIK